ncbi:NeuD/PglB/VioB family sugar acetyltransferase [Micrococcus luteus]|uniref:NeuD/PglB/VioB family sugar acetyltransferase n=1 Tax=Micrococcus TaxID=1269 RepID=UPI0019D031FA|nr:MULTISPECIES: NeuD/PglB/VioB family sugar acetyltransferase [Micrococcus]MCV7522699.1 NeuD/PglB/VioB family sugar acetyltransferase [Micrococcus luteus]MCV7674071.1 NeuD/PglB/VioB family sugar acetyltransferase [Micrococcus luteus]MCV7696609.1 NeuD/PglB/VioB family sugar acetyltransferase [Micrococcus luteus]
MNRPLHILGAGGFGREAADVVEAALRAGTTAGWTLAGVYDDAISEQKLRRLEERGLAYLGALPPNPPEPGAGLIVAIGDPVARQRVSARAAAAGWTFPAVVHPEAVVGSRLTMGDGVVVCGGVHVSTNVTLGDHVHLNPHSTIGHDARLEDCVSVNPAAVISGEVLVRTCTLIGAGATVLQGLVVGARSTVGAMACVTRDVADRAIVKGVPAR